MFSADSERKPVIAFLYAFGGILSGKEKQWHEMFPFLKTIFSYFPTISSMSYYIKVYWLDIVPVFINLLKGTRFCYYTGYHNYKDTRYFSLAKLWTLFKGKNTFINWNYINSYVYVELFIIFCFDNIKIQTKNEI